MRTAGGSMGWGSILLVLLFAPTAFAAGGLEPGVHVDPGSPAGKEYALPLTQARQTGAHGNSTSSEGTLFGAGIKPSGPHGGAGAHQHPSGATSHAAGEASGAASAAPSPASVLPQLALPVHNTRAQEGGGSSRLALIGGGLAVLLLGAFGGTVLRRTRRPGSGSAA